VVDVDNMRTLKELAGRRAGKHALRIVAGIIRASVRSGDLVGRIGGGEFGIFLPGASTNNALQVAERIRQTVAEAQFSAAGSNWQLSVSTGAVLFETEINFDELMRAADLQLEVAKKMGRNRIAHTSLQPGSSTPLAEASLGSSPYISARRYVARRYWRAASMSIKR
jgi:diguanylate cyclase (GGDEF)-like protein